MSSSIFDIETAADMWVTVDYLRITRERHAAEEDFWFYALEHVSDERKAGYRLTPYQIGNMKGGQAGGGAIAQNDTHLLVEFRGGSAEKSYHWYKTMGGKATRIDFAITVRLKSDFPGLAAEAHHLATDYLTQNKMQERRKMPVLVGGHDGWTCYLGSRTSERYFRLYDKWRQMGDESYKYCWRFEVELKGGRAAEAWRLVRAGINVYELAKAEIAAMLETQGLRIDNLNTCVPPATSGRTKTPPDVARQLEWLSKQVAPTLASLIQRGFEDNALDALGLLESSPIILEKP